VSFPARGNDVAISAWYIPHEGSRKALILVHGKDNNRVAEFDVHFVDFAASFHERGFTVLMIDLRGHGLSGEGHVSWGMNERRDIEGAVGNSKAFERVVSECGEYRWARPRAFSPLRMILTSGRSLQIVVTHDCNHS
jgi:alpha-beta hydrolase superfamily lysophospholipase